MNGFTQVENAALLDTRLSLQARALFAILRGHAWGEVECYPGQETLAKEAGVTQRSVRRYLDELIKHGYVTATRNGQGRTNTYALVPLRQDTRVLSSSDDRTAASALERTRVSSPMKKTQLKKMDPPNPPRRRRRRPREVDDSLKIYDL